MNDVVVKVPLFEQPCDAESFVISLQFRYCARRHLICSM